MRSFERHHWPALAGRAPFAGGALVEARLWHDRPGAEVYRFAVDHGDRRAAYFWKRHKTNGERAVSEYRALARLAAHFEGRSDLGVVEPVALIEKDRALVTAEFIGTDVREIVSRGVRRGAGRAARDAAAAAVRAVAGFIREMQQAEPPERRDVDLDPLLSWVVDDLSRCLETGMLEGSTTALARQVVERARRQRIGRDAVVVAANSDTKLWNFLIGECGALRALDFVGIQRDLPTHDFARVWVGLDWLRVFPRTSPAAVDRLQAILAAELASYALFDADTFAFHRLCVAVRAAAFASGIRGDRYRRKLRSIVGFPLIRRYYRSLVRRCATAAIDGAGNAGCPDPAVLARRLAERAPDWFADLGAPVEVVARPFAHGSTYPIRRFAIRGGAAEHEVVVKIPPAFAENNEPLTEYQNLRLLAPALARSGAPVSAPPPLDVLTDLGAVVTRFVPHVRFSTWLLENNRHLASAETAAELRSLCRRAGELLALIHRETSAGEVAIGDSGMVAGFWDALALAYEHGLGHASCDAVARLLADFPPRLAGLRAPRALAHGDYAPQNLGIAGGDLVVFDLQRNRDEVVYADIAYFLVTLETINPLPGYPLFSRRRAIAAGDDFVRGYFGGDPTPDQAMALRLYVLEQLVRRLHKQSSNVARSGSWVRRQVFTRGSVERFYPAAIARELAALDALVARAG